MYVEKLMAPKSLRYILSDCHYSDVINSLLNAFRLKKMIHDGQQLMSKIQL